MEEPWYICWPLSIFVLLVVGGLFVGMAIITAWVLFDIFPPN